MKLFSGDLQANHAGGSGGAVSVEGSESSDITVQIGVNDPHFAENKLSMGFPHQDATTGMTFLHNACPVIRGNTSNVSGGAFFISGGIETNLRIFCLTEEENTSAGDRDINKTPLSDFMMVQGGRVVVSTASNTDSIWNTDKVENNTDGYGKAAVNGSIHVVAGQMELMGNMDNPQIDGIRTIDLQNANDRYFDHRGSDTMVKISYHENFTNTEGVTESTYTAIDLASGEPHTIYTGLYVHEGYELYGWSTDKNAVAGSESFPWYAPGTAFTFYNEAQKQKPADLAGSTDFEKQVHYGDLTLYAIWKINGYFIAFDPGVPEGETWSGSVETVSCKFNEPYPLPVNGFVRPGYCFTGWKLKDKVYQPGTAVQELTGVNAATVTFVAQWKPCDHTADENGGVDPIRYSVTQDTMTKTCAVCSQKGTAKILAQDAVYDGQSHPATLELSNAEFWDPVLTHTGTKLDGTGSVADENTCVNAGDYVAKLQAGDNTISAAFRIEKAPQPAPTSRPRYVQPSDSNEVTIYQLPDETQRVCNTSGVPVEYYLRYYSDNAEVIVPVTHGDLEKDTTLQYTLTEALKTYTVLAGYPETDNYYASDFITADTTFQFAGNIHLTIEAEEGIDFWLENVTNQDYSGTMLHTKLREGYYLAGEDFTFTKKLAEGSQYDLDKLTITPVKVGEYTTSATASDTEVYITVTIGGVKKIAALSAECKEKQHFGDFSSGTNCEIAVDSAFTVLYRLSGFDQEDYAQPSLNFAPKLPAGTRIILRDRADGSYWYFRAAVSTAEVSLIRFAKMGATDTNYFAKTGDRNLQFVVDFSRVAKEALLPAPGTVTCSLSVAKTMEDSKAMPLDPAAVTVGLKNVSCTLEPVQIQVPSLTRALAVKIHVGEAASKYDHRDLALVLTPDAATPLPIDASMQVSMQGYSITYRPNQQNRLVIPLGDFCGMDAPVQLRLSSDMFPYSEETYKMTAQLLLSATDAESAIGNPEQLTEAVSLAFYSNREHAGLKIIGQGDKRLFQKGEQIPVTISTTLADQSGSYPISVQLHQKFPDGTYGNTALQPQEEGNTYTFQLNSLVEGSYCIVATLSNSDAYVLDEARYYFLLQEP